MGQALPKSALRPFLAGGYARAGGDLRCRHPGTDRRRLQRGAAGGLGGRGRGRRRVRQEACGRTDPDRDAAEFAGRLCLAERQRPYRHALSCIRAWPGRASAPCCAMRWKSLPARAAPKASPSMPATTRWISFSKRGYVAKQRNSVTDQRRMARQHHDAEDAGRCRAGSARNEPRTPLSVRHHAARRRADQRRRLHAA